MEGPEAADSTDKEKHSEKQESSFRKLYEACIVWARRKRLEQEVRDTRMDIEVVDRDSECEHGNNDQRSNTVERRKMGTARECSFLR